MGAAREERSKAVGEMAGHIRAVRGIEDDERDAIVPEHSPVGESKSSGAIENALKRLQGQVRTIKMALQEAVDGTICEDPDVWQWFVEFAADMFNRYKPTATVHFHIIK